MKSLENTGPRAEMLRQLPSVDELAGQLRHSEWANGASDTQLTEAARESIETYRQRILDAFARPKESPPVELKREQIQEELLEAARAYLEKNRRSCLRSVINATGIVLHTNLGRAPLSEAACNALAGVARGYSNLEYDLEAGSRGHRESCVEDLLQRLTGAEAALVVNNNAAAVMFALTVMAKGREVIVSRGEMVEIGGSFRIPDIMVQSGARLVEVGTTNKTRPTDYEHAVTSETALLLKVHTSNYRIVGFTEETSRHELATLGAQLGLPVLEDLGSGCLLHIPGLPFEPTVADSVTSGIDVVTFSGDKLLGGPQAGIIVGKHRWIERLKTHPWMRILRPDKLTLSALETTLRAYLNPEAALREIPALRMLAEDANSVRERAERLAAALDEGAVRLLHPEVVETKGRVGGGAMPLADLKSFALQLAPRRISAETAAKRLRDTDPPVIGRIQEDKLLLDLRCVYDDEVEILARLLSALAHEVSGSR